MTEGFRIRTATPRDNHAIATAHVETWKVAYRGQIADEILDGLSTSERAGRWVQWWAKRIEDETLFVAEVGSDVVGFVNTGPSRDPDATVSTGEIRAIYLLPDHWSKGIGRALMDRGLETLRSRFTEAILWVLESNARARRFYERGGWQADGASQLLEGLAVVEVRYRIEL